MMTKTDINLAETADIARHATEALAESAARVQRIQVSGQFYWVKREERLTMRMRLQKGNPHHAFEAEKTAIHALSSIKAPVPPVVAEGPDYFVTPDCGPSLKLLLRDPTAHDRVEAFYAAGEGLAGFHHKRISHGRPSIKDISWDGKRATFLDFERYARKRNCFAGHVQDVVILIFSAFAETGRTTPETNALIESYRSCDSAGIWEGAERFCRRLRWVDPLTKPIQKFKKSGEFSAIPLTLSAFGVL